MKWILRIIAFAVLVGCILWWLNDRSYEPFICILTSLGGLIGSFIEADTVKSLFKQRGGANSTNQQAGGNIANKNSFNKKK